MPSDFFETMRENQGNRINREDQFRGAGRSEVGAEPREERPSLHSPSIENTEETPQKEPPPFSG